MQAGALPVPFRSYYNDSGRFIAVVSSSYDNGVVYPILLDLYLEGYNIWYEDGRADAAYTKEQAEQYCSCVMIFVSESLCRDRQIIYDAANMASTGKPVIFVMIDNCGGVPSEIYNAARQARVIERCRINSETFLNQLGIILPDSFRTGVELVAPLVDVRTYPAAFPENDGYAPVQQVQYAPAVGNDDYNYDLPEEQNIPVDKDEQERGNIPSLISDSVGKQKVAKLLITAVPILLSIFSLLTAYCYTNVEANGGNALLMNALGVGMGIILFIVASRANFENCAYIPYSFGVLGLAMAVYSLIFATAPEEVAVLELHGYSIRTDAFLLLNMSLCGAAVIKEQNTAEKPAVHGVLYGLMYILAAVILVLQGSYVGLAVLLITGIAVTAMSRKLKGFISAIIIAVAAVAVVLLFVPSANSALNAYFADNTATEELIHSALSTGGLLGSNISVVLEDTLGASAAVACVKYLGVLTVLIWLAGVCFIYNMGIKLAREEYMSYTGIASAIFSLVIGTWCVFAGLSSIGVLPLSGIGVPFLDSCKETTVMGFLWAGFVLAQYRKQAAGTPFVPSEDTRWNGTAVIAGKQYEVGRVLSIVLAVIIAAMFIIYAVVL